MLKFEFHVFTHVMEYSSSFDFFFFHRLPKNEQWTEFKLAQANLGICFFLI